MLSILKAFELLSIRRTLNLTKTIIAATHIGRYSTTSTTTPSPLKWQTSVQCEMVNSPPRQDYSEPAMYLLGHELCRTVGTLFSAICAGKVADVLLLIDSVGINASDRYRNSALHVAAQYAQHEILVLLVGLGADVNATNETGATPLFHAAHSSHKCLLALAGFGANIFHRDVHGYGPIHYAVLGDNIACVDTLVHLGVNVDWPALPLQYTPLMLVNRSKPESVHMVRALLRHGASTKATDTEGLTPVFFYALKHPECMKVFAEKRKLDLQSTDHNGCTPIYYASMNTSEMVVMMARMGADMNARSKSWIPLMAAMDASSAVLFVQMGARVNTCTMEGETALHRAAFRGSADLANILVYLGADMESVFYEWTPLGMAAFSGNLSVLLELIKLGAEVDASSGRNGFTALHWAVIAEEEEAAQELLRFGANINKPIRRGGHLLMNEAIYSTADQYKTLRVMKLALRLGANVNVSASNNSSLLHYALNGEVVKVLIEAGSTGWLVEDDNGETPLFSAARLNRSDVIEELVKAGAQVNHRNKNQRTALHDACSMGSPRAVDALIQHGAEVDVRCSEGETPLHASTVNPILVKLLLAAKADVNLRNNYGQTALHFAKDVPESLRLLLDAGAEVNIKDQWGCTPLHGISNATSAAMLLDAGAKILVPNNRGEMPHKSTRSLQVVDLLNQHIIATPKDAGM